ncbi:MAG: hypothetical protein AAAFM81_14130 [Pseudomonadota bacterium]
MSLINIPRVALAILLLLGGCVATPVVPPAVNTANENTPAVLLVSRHDGSVVRQHVAVDADICLKAAETPETTCFKKGAPLFDRFGTFVGYEMLEQRVSLYPAQ